MSVLFILCMFLLLALIFLYYIYQRKCSYWKKRNVPFLQPSPIFGNFKDYILMKKYAPEITKNICEQFPYKPYIGVFYGSDPALVVMDPELIKLITTKDFYYFNGREVADYTHREVITQNIFFTQGDRWKVLRQNLSPLFSSTRIKNMFYLIKKCATELDALLERELKVSSTIEIRELMSRFTIDGVSLCGFGINSNTMGEQGDLNPFRIISKKILEVSPLNGIKFIARTLWPCVFYNLGFKMFSPQVNGFFNKLLVEIFEERQYRPSSRNDFVDLILSLRKNSFITGDSLTNSKTDSKKVNMEVNDDLLVSQCVAFFAGGFETTSAALTFTLYELAKHEEKQKLAIADVDNYFLKHQDGIEYDITTEVPYLDACIDETLRLYPLLCSITREVMEDYTLPDGLRLEKGLRIHIPVYYLHFNSDYFENPQEFKPERFLGDNKNNIKSYTYLPFGEGPRICIGLRFAKMKMLTGLATILSKYRIKLADGMPRQVKFEPKAIVTQPAQDIMLTFMPRQIIQE